MEATAYFPSKKNEAPDFIEFPYCSTALTIADLEDGQLRRLLPGDINIIAKDCANKCMKRIEPCYACTWEKEEHDEDASCNYSHFCRELPERYQHVKKEQLIASMDPLEILEKCSSIATNIAWCISYLKKQFSDPTWLNYICNSCNLDK